MIDSKDICALLVGYLLCSYLLIRAAILTIVDPAKLACVKEYVVVEVALISLDVHVLLLELFNGQLVCDLTLADVLHVPMLVV